MPSESQRQLMHEALDLALSAEQAAQLQNELEDDVHAALEFQRLQRIDALLRSAPMERAPQRLALSIMAKLAETLEAEAAIKADTQEAAARKIGLALVILITLPVLTAALGLFLLASGNPELLQRLLGHIINLLEWVMHMLEAFVQSARELMQSNPEVPALLTALVPVTLYWILHSSAENAKEQKHENHR